MWRAPSHDDPGTTGDRATSTDAESAASRAARRISGPGHLHRCEERCDDMICILGVVGSPPTHRERFGSSEPPCPPCGSPPHVWRVGGGWCNRHSVGRVTSIRMESTSSQTLRHQQRAVHLHKRGEYWVKNSSTCRLGVTSTHVKNASGYWTVRWATLGYLHGCGEHLYRIGVAPSGMGSPPRTWRARHAPRRWHGQHRVTSTRMESASPC